MISCTDHDDTNLDKPLAAVPLKKEKKSVKPKKKKPILADKKTTEQDDDADAVIETKAVAPADNAAMINILGNKVGNYAVSNGYSTEICFLIDMTLPSGRNRFFVYDLEKNSVINTGLVAHGSCNEDFISHPKFSNMTKSGCSSLGKYKVGEFYMGKYGKSFRLYGLDKSNSNAFKRSVVIHGYDCVPDQEIYPRVLCNSLGCVMVSYKFFDQLSKIIRRSNKPIILWIYG